MDERKVWAAGAAQAWQNAAIACSQDDSRPQLYRTMSVEFFRAGVQFVATDGTMLFRAWARYSDCGDLPAQMPAWSAKPKDSIVVMDADRFALGFMKTLGAACTDEAGAGVELTLSVVDVEPPEEPALDAVLAHHALAFEALGQRLTCPLYDGAFPDWRALNLGIDNAERVESMTVAPRLLAALGKIKGASRVDLDFSGTDRAIRFDCGDVVNVNGLIMPMRRLDEKKEKEPEPPSAGAVMDEVLDHAEALRPKPGSGIDSVTISSGNRSVTLTANGTGEARGLELDDVLESLRTELLRVGFDVPVKVMKEEWRDSTITAVVEWASRVQGVNGEPPMPYPAVLAQYETEAAQG